MCFSCFSPLSLFFHAKLCLSNRSPPGARGDGSRTGELSGESVTNCRAPGLRSTTNRSVLSSALLIAQAQNKMWLTLQKTLGIGDALGSNAHVSRMPCWVAADVVSGGYDLAGPTLWPATVQPKRIPFEQPSFDPLSHVAAVVAWTLGFQAFLDHLTWYLDQMPTFVWPRIPLVAFLPLVFAGLQWAEIPASCVHCPCLQHTRVRARRSLEA